MKKVMKVDSNKKVFLIRNKIDQDYQEESQKEKFNEKDFRTDIKDKCFEEVKGLQDGNEFFIITESVDDEKNWDFQNLKIALLNALKSPQKECLTLLLGLISKRMLKEKVDLLQGSYTVKLNLEKHVGYILLKRLYCFVRLFYQFSGAFCTTYAGTNRSNLYCFVVCYLHDNFTKFSLFGWSTNI